MPHTVGFNPTEVTVQSLLPLIVSFHRQIHLHAAKSISRASDPAARAIILGFSRPEPCDLAVSPLHDALKAKWYYYSMRACMGLRLNVLSTNRCCGREVGRKSFLSAVALAML